MKVMRIWAGALVAGLLTVIVAIAQENPPLPKGAVAQIGQVSSAFSARVLDVRFSPDGASFITGRASGSVQLWDLKSGKATLTLLDPWREKDKGAEAVLFSHDGKHLFAAGSEMGLRSWLARTGEPVWQSDKGSDPLAISPDGKTLASLQGFDGRIILRDAESGKQRGTLEGHKQYLTSLAFSPDGKSLVSASGDRTVRSWDLASGKEVWRHGKESSDFAIGPSFPHCLSISSDGKWVAVSYHGCWQLGLVVLEARMGTKSSEADLGHSDAIAFLPGRNAVALQAGDGRIRLWDADQKKFTGRTAGIHKGRMFGMACSPDGSRLVTAGDDGLILVWDLSQIEPDEGK